MYLEIQQHLLSAEIFKSELPVWKTFYSAVRDTEQVQEWFGGAPWLRVKRVAHGNDGPLWPWRMRFLQDQVLKIKQHDMNSAGGKDLSSVSDKLMVCCFPCLLLQSQVSLQKGGNEPLSPKVQVTEWLRCLRAFKASKSLRRETLQMKIVVCAITLFSKLFQWQEK